MMTRQRDYVEDLRTNALKILEQLREAAEAIEVAKVKVEDAADDLRTVSEERISEAAETDKAAGADDRGGDDARPIHE